ncbi:S8 family serine peptidase [Niabella yanshanensis]|uniref:S8 family serine peptidase n=1 Tax=Niabella yanshanensis TaxID=577386 RepID=A0ABZ0W5W4_9BACT|nr:S8 family serine peptidase [Niabella yanshanensis]WQD36917.1 S8 family serine peptidase [Niabella yanshanensis]
MRCFVLGLLVLCALGVNGQSVKPVTPDWHYLDYKTDGYLGISLQQAYDLLKNKKSTPVIVAVIDSGIDTLQPDLKPVLWTNPKEIPNNKSDDDGNGLVDDYYGWNFLGAPDGENLAMSISDEYRTFYRFKAVFENKTQKQIPDSLSWQYQQWISAKARLEEGFNDAQKVIGAVRKNFSLISDANTAMQQVTGKEVFFIKDLDSLESNPSVKDLVSLWRNLLSEQPSGNNQALMKDFGNYKQSLEDDLIKLTTPPDEARNNLLKDNGYDINAIHYGNHNLTTHSGYHGTSVSSIIGAVRNNKEGIDGIADNVKIMMIRGILGKDEFDKDVALSIRYAVDHGAKVINMSFGKYISPDKRWVDEAIAYALSKDVVLVHGSGNDASDNDVTANYPSSYTIGGKLLPNVIQVGASGDESLGRLVASFSNYGKKTVDVFAPGVQIRCAIAGKGTEISSGTSLSSPIVAGIAALLRSYFPHLTATEVVNIIKESGTIPSEKVLMPGDDKKLVALSELCSTGKIVNAANAVKLAIEN